MDENEKNAPENPAEIEGLEVNPISDEDLDSVAGGAAGCTGCGATGCCTTVADAPEEAT